MKTGPTHNGNSNLEIMSRFGLRASSDFMNSVLNGMETKRVNNKL